jgi:hypothetical protein
VQQAKSTCKRKGLFKDYEDALEAESRSDEQAKSFQRAITNAMKKGADKPSQSLQDKLKAALIDALLEKKAAEEAQATSAEGFFLLYANFSAKTPDSAGTRLSSVKSEQPRGPIFKGTIHQGAWKE